MAGISEDVKRQALSAVAAVKTNIQAVQMTGNSTPAQLTPKSDLSNEVAGKLARMEKSGYDASARQRAMTKDDFTRG